MRRISILWVGLVTIFTLGTIIIGSASAETTLLAEYLDNGKPILTLTATESFGSVVIADAKTGLKLTCSAISVGSVGANGEGEVTEVLNLSKVTATLTKPLVCTGCSAPAELAPENLPWHTTLVLTQAGTFRTIYAKNTDWAMCNILGFLTEEECTFTNSSYEVLNVAGGVEAMGEVTPLASCTVGGAEAGSLTFEPGNLMTSTAGTISTSSE